MIIQVVNNVRLNPRSEMIYTSSRQILVHLKGLGGFQRLRQGELQEAVVIGVDAT